MKKKYTVPRGLKEYMSIHKSLDVEQIDAIKQWARSLPIVRYDPGHDKHHRHHHCCCCCCCHKHDDQPTMGAFRFHPKLGIRIEPMAPVPLIRRVEGTITWSAPQGTQSVKIEWERYGPNGPIAGFTAIPYLSQPLPASGFVMLDTGWGQFGTRIHFRIVTDQGIVSDIFWLDGNNSQGWL